MPRAVPFSIAATNAKLVDVNDLSGHVAYRGFCAIENAGTPAAASIKFRVGSATGDIIDEAKLVASGSINPGPYNEGDLYAVTTGTVEGVVYID